MIRNKDILYFAITFSLNIYAAQATNFTEQEGPVNRRVSEINSSFNSDPALYDNVQNLRLLDITLQKVRNSRNINKWINIHSIKIDDQE